MIDQSGLPAEAKEVIKRFPEFELFNFNDTGQNGYVLLGRHAVLQQDVAVKIYFHQPDELNQEPSVIAGIQHENVMKVLDARKLDEECAFFMTPFANDGDLASFIKTRTPDTHLAFQLLRQLLSGLGALHSKQLLHRDLKPQNLLIHDDKLLISDFGSVRQLQEGASSVPASKHSILYRPPEAFGDKGYFDFSSDCYQAGIVGYLLFGGTLNDTLEEYLTKAQAAQLAKLKYENVPTATEALFVDDCLRQLIEKNRLLDWASLPPHAPKKLVRTLRRACASQNRIGDVSEFMAELAACGPLPNWRSLGEETYILRNWQKHDYLVTMAQDEFRVKKRRVGQEKFINDNVMSGGHWTEGFKKFSEKIGIC